MRGVGGRCAHTAHFPLVPLKPAIPHIFSIPHPSYPPPAFNFLSQTYLALRVLVSVEELLVVLLVGPAREEEGKGGADGSDDRQDTRIIHAEHLVIERGKKGTGAEANKHLMPAEGNRASNSRGSVGIPLFPHSSKRTHTSPVPSVAKTGEARMRGVRPARADFPVLTTSVILLFVADILIAWRVRRGPVGMKPRAACMHTKRIAREKKTFILTGSGVVGGLCHAREGTGKEGKGQGEG